MDSRELSQANNRVVRRLGLVVLAMFGFGFALVPLYDIFCEVTGLNGKTGRIAAGEAHLLNLCVRPESQRQGIGKKLLVHLFTLARHHDAEIMFLEVRESNATARRLYDKAGFNELGTRKDYYPAGAGRENALILARVL